MPRELINAAGEAEGDRRSARWNLVEALVVFGALELSIWGLVAGLGMARGSRAWLFTGHAALGLCLLYIVALSPWVHGDTAHSWGLPRRGALRQRLGDTRLRAPTLGMLTVLGCAVTLAVWQGWPNLLARLGVRRHFRAAFDWLTLTTSGSALGGALGALVLLRAAVWAVRWDNLDRSLRALAPLALGLWLSVPALAVLYALATGDWSRLRAPRWLEIHPDRTSVIFYLLWGFVQQGLFLGYFNARFRRAIAPRRRGLLPSRALAALLTGLVFGAVHLPNLPLVGLGAVEGALLAWAFQSDATRNLFVAAVIHAVAGTLFSALLPVSMEIGPWE